MSLTPQQKRTAERLINLFERKGPDDDGYANTERDDDGRGWTCGVAGFTTATGDVLEVVREYAIAHPVNSLTRWLHILEFLAKNQDGETDDLPGFDHDWRLEAQNPTFRAAQDTVRDRLYYVPAMDYAEQYDLNWPYSKAVLFESAIMQGCGNDFDSLGAMLKRAEKQVAARKPKIQTARELMAADLEREFMREFLDVREAVCNHAADPATRACWKQAVPRVWVQREILERGNYQLTTPFTIETRDYEGQVID